MSQTSNRATILRYDPLAGKFYRRSRRSGWYEVSCRPGKDGYPRLKWEGRVVECHRLAFLFMEGVMPVEVDHRDRDRSNFKWDNLRPTTRTLNMNNLGCRKDSSTGVRGVSVLPSGNYRARYRKESSTHPTLSDADQWVQERIERHDKEAPDF